jgi:LPS export ABC transporter protein LptC
LISFRSKGPSKKRKLAQGLTLAFALGLTLVLIFGVWKGRSQKELQTVQTTDKSDAEMRLSDMEFTELQEGKRLWTIKAAEAKYFQEQQRTLLAKVRITFFLQNGEEIQLESQEGALYAGTKNIELWDSVHAVLPGGYQLSTERVYYDHQKRTIASEAAVQLAGPDVQLEGRVWEYRIPENKAVVEGGVQGALVFLPSKTRPVP